MFRLATHMVLVLLLCFPYWQCSDFHFELLTRAGPQYEFIRTLHILRIKVAIKLWMYVRMYWVSQVSMLLAYRVTYFKSLSILPYILNIFSIHSSEIRGFWCSIKCYSKSNFTFACYFQNSR